MSFTSEEVSAFVRTLPEGALKGVGPDKAFEWCSYLASVDVNPKAAHDLFWYMSMGRYLAEQMGSVSPLDFAHTTMRDMIGNVIKPGEKPYTAEAESAQFRAWVVEPAQIAFAYRVQAKCARATPPEPTPENTLAGTMKEYLEAQAASHKRSVKALSFKLTDRLSELGMDDFAKDALPSEENLAVFEAAGRVARDKGRLYVGSADGEDLQRNFRPSWSRVPRVDLPVGEGSVPERQRQMAEMKRARAASELDYPGYSTFHGHVVDWGVKLILMKTATPLDVLGYTALLSKVAEEHGGARTAYQYDVLVRTAMAKALESGDPGWKTFFSKIDRDLAKEAKDKVTARGSEAAKGAQSKGWGKGKPGKPGKSESSEPKGAGRGSGGGSGGSSGSQAPVRSFTPPRSRSPWASRKQGDSWHQGGGWQKSSWSRK